MLTSVIARTAENIQHFDANTFTTNKYQLQISAFLTTNDQNLPVDLLLYCDGALGALCSLIAARPSVVASQVNICSQRGTNHPLIRASCCGGGHLSFAAFSPPFSPPSVSPRSVFPHCSRPPAPFLPSFLFLLTVSLSFFFPSESPLLLLFFPSLSSGLHASSSSLAPSQPPPLLHPQCH